jgi:hypothetical protein
MNQMAVMLRRADLPQGRIQEARLEMMRDLGEQQQESVKNSEPVGGLMVRAVAERQDRIPDTHVCFSHNFCIQDGLHHTRHGTNRLSVTKICKC